MLRRNKRQVFSCPVSCTQQNRPEHIKSELRIRRDACPVPKLPWKADRSWFRDIRSEFSVGEARTLLWARQSLGYLSRIKGGSPVKLARASSKLRITPPPPFQEFFGPRLEHREPTYLTLHARQQICTRYQAWSVMECNKRP